jgi:hypothetical protein
MQQSVGARQAAIAIKLLFQDALGIDLRSLDLVVEFKQMVPTGSERFRGVEVTNFGEVTRAPIVSVAQARVANPVA